MSETECVPGALFETIRRAEEPSALRTVGLRRAHLYTVQESCYNDYGKEVIDLKKHRRKMIAPIVITALVVLYYVGFFTVFLKTVEAPFIAKLLLGVIPLLLAGASIFVLVERIKEIRSGEEDDLSQY